MIVALVPLVHAPSGPAASWWLTGAVAIWALSIVLLFGYLVLAADPDGELIPTLVLGAMFVGFLWPAVTLLPFVGLVYGLRWLVHGPKPSVSRADRRDARIRRRDERIAELERDLGL